MRTNFEITQALRRRLGGVAASLLLLSGLSAFGQTFSSPVGDWDMVISGVRSGVAQVSFFADGTITLGEVLVPKLPSSAGHTATDSRGTGGDDSRGGPLPTYTLPDHTNLHGYFSLPQNDVSLDGGALLFHSGVPIGQWGFDVSGHLVGFFSEISAAMTITTNVIETVTNVEYLRITNAISFTGKVSINSQNPLNNRLTLLCSTPAGKSTYSGLPPISLPDLSGNWYGTKTQAGLPYNEFYSLAAPDAFFTSYSTDGTGPIYIFSGITMVTRQNKIGVALGIIRPHNPPPDQSSQVIVRALYGSINLNKKSFTATGMEDTDTDIQKVTYKGFFSPALPAP